MKLTVVYFLLFGITFGHQHSKRPRARATCPVQIDDDKRRDCYRWPTSDLRRECAARGCVYCEHGQHGVPWCFYDDTVCPSKIDDGARVECHPDPGASKEACNSRGCIWCHSPTPGVPFCFYDNSTSQGGERCPSDIRESERIDCHPQGGVSKQGCLSRGCFYCPSQTQGVPWCFAPRAYGYEMNGQVINTQKGYRVNLMRKKTPSWYGAEIEAITLDVEFQEDSRLRLKLYDHNNARFEPPVGIPSPDEKAENPLYDVEFGNDPSFYIVVKRKSTGETLFDTSMGGLTFSDQFLQFSTRLASGAVYGIGETKRLGFKHDMNYKTFGLFARDEPPNPSANLYGVHPFYTVIEKDGKSHGVLISNSNAQDMSLIPAPGMVYRTIGGVLDVCLFLGPSPEGVVQQYIQAVGKPVMPPYWALGFHLSRYGYEHENNLKAAVQRMRQYDIPHDVQHGDIDTMDRFLDFTYDKTNFSTLPSYIDQLSSEGTRYITVLDPCISKGEPTGTYPPFERGQELDIWIKNSDRTTPVEGRVWPKDNVYFPDYTKGSTVTWWNEQCVRWKNTISFEGLWLDMNEPANFVKGSINGCSNNSKTVPPYFPKIWGSGELAEKTICADTIQQLGEHYDVHSLYGHSQAQATLSATRASNPGKRSYVIGRSTFPGSGQYCGHWLGDNGSQWSDLAYSIVGLLDFNLFGIPFVGADICGYFNTATAELCLRWMQLGAFYTFSRNHNGKNNAPQDPGAFGPDVARASRDALHIRYTLLPYLYTLFHKAHTEGATVIRPIHHEYPNDEATHSISRQFLWGPALLISPVLDQGAVSVNGYIPAGRWFSYQQGQEEAITKEFVILDAPLDVIPVHVRGGHVIPTQEPANSTVFSRQNALGFIAALDDQDEASGELFWDDGESLDTYEKGQYAYTEYKISKNEFKSTITHTSADMNRLLYQSLRVLGVRTEVTQVRINSAQHTDFQYDSKTKELKVSQMNLDATKTFTINWS